MSFLSDSYGREYAEPYLEHSIGPITGYGVSIVMIASNSQLRKYL